MDKEINRWRQEIDKLTQKMTVQIIHPYCTHEQAEIYAREHFFTYASLKTRNQLLNLRKVFEQKYPNAYSEYMNTAPLHFEMGSPKRIFYQTHLHQLLKEFKKEEQSEPLC